MEPFGGVDRFLTGHGVHYQNHFLGIDSFFNVVQFLHQIFVYLDPAAGVDDGPVDSKLASLLKAVLGNLDDRGSLRVF